MTNKQKRERKLGNALRAARGHFQRAGDTLVPVRQTQTARALGARINRCISRCQTA